MARKKLKRKNVYRPLAVPPEVFELIERAQRIGNHGTRITTVRVAFERYLEDLQIDRQSA